MRAHHPRDSLVEIGAELSNILGVVLYVDTVSTRPLYCAPAVRYWLDTAAIVLSTVLLIFVWCYAFNYCEIVRLIESFCKTWIIAANKKGTVEYFPPISSPALVHRAGLRAVSALRCSPKIVMKFKRLDEWMNDFLYLHDYVWCRRTCWQYASARRRCCWCV